MDFRQKDAPGYNSVAYAKSGKPFVFITQNFLYRDLISQIHILAHEIKHTMQEPLPEEFSAASRWSKGWQERWREIDANKFANHLLRERAKVEGWDLKQFFLDMAYHRKDVDSKLLNGTGIIASEIAMDLASAVKGSRHQYDRVLKLNEYRMCGGKEVPPYYWDVAMDVMAKMSETIGLQSLADTARKAYVTR
jgi:hypothetical protein